MFQCNQGTSRKFFQTNGAKPLLIEEQNCNNKCIKVNDITHLFRKACQLSNKDKFVSEIFVCDQDKAKMHHNNKLFSEVKTT